MARVCAVCTHPDREKIDAEIVTGLPLRQIAAQHGVHQSCVRRHKDTHLGPEMRKAAIGRGLTVAHLVGELRNLYDKALAILEKAEADENPRVALMAIGAARAVLQTAGELITAADLEKRMDALEERMTE